MSLFDLGNNALRNNELQRKIEEEALFEQAVNSVRTGTAPAGGNIDVPLKTSQKITVVALNSDYKYYYTTYDFTKNALSKTVNSGLHDDDWIFDEMIPDAMGYSFVVYAAAHANERKVQYVGPDAKVIEEFNFNSSVFNHFNYITYYNGGIGLFMYNGSSGGDAKFYYAYNGQLYQKSWDGNFYGMQFDGSNSVTINGAANFYLNLPTYGAEHWRIIPGEGFVLVDQYYDINISQHEVQPYFMPDGKPSFFGYFADYNITLASFNNYGDYLQSFLIWKDKSEPYLDVYALIQDKLLEKYGVNDFNQIYLSNWSWCRGGDAICLTLRDNAAEEDYTVVVNVKTKTIDFVIDRVLGDLILNPHPTTLLWFTYDFNGSFGSFISSDIAFKIDMLYPDNTHEQFTIPKLSGGNEVNITYPFISKNGNHFTLLSFVDDDDCQLKIARSSKGNGITYTNIFNWKAVGSHTQTDVCYSDLINDWFIQLKNYLDSPDRIEMLSISRDGAILGPASTIDVQGNTQYYTYGGTVAPELVHAYFPAGINKVWRLNYRNYKWEEVISITAVPTGDSYITSYTQFYYGGRMFEDGSSYLVFVDPDAFVSYYFSTKYGVVKTDNVPLWSIAPTGTHVGQSYTTVFSLVDDDDSFAISTSTGKRVSRSYIVGDTPYFGEAVSDVFVYGHGPDEPGNNKLDLIAGWKKKTINWDDSVWWRYHDMVHYNY